MLHETVLSVAPHRVTFRPAGSDDHAFLRAVYGDTRAEELAPVPWPETEKQRFLDQQFAAQDESYRSNYPGAAFFLIVVDEQPAGRLYLHVRPAELRIMDIALLAAYRGHGVGGAILRHLQEAGHRENRALTIHVESFNPARRLYDRLGFRTVGSTEVYLLMEWLPSAPLRS